MIQFKDVTLQYPYEEFCLFRGLNFTLDDGLNTVLCDAQSGKTSLCRLLVKDVVPTSGQIELDGRPIDGISNDNLGILYLSGKPSFFEGRSILYNIQYPLRVRHVSKAVRNGIASELAARLGIEPARKPAKLSQAERKRVALARGLTVARSCVLWDDFFDEEDADDITRTMSMFDNICHVLVTDNARLAIGNTVVLDGGLAVFQGGADEARRYVAELGWLSDSLRSR